MPPTSGTSSTIVPPRIPAFQCLVSDLTVLALIILRVRTSISLISIAILAFLEVAPTAPKVFFLAAPRRPPPPPAFGSKVVIAPVMRMSAPSIRPFSGPRPSSTYPDWPRSISSISSSTSSLLASTIKLSLFVRAVDSISPIPLAMVLEHLLALDLILPTVMRALLP